MLGGTASPADGAHLYQHHCSAREGARKPYIPSPLSSLPPQPTSTKHVPDRGTGDGNLMGSGDEDTTPQPTQPPGQEGCRHQDAVPTAQSLPCPHSTLWDTPKTTEFFPVTVQESPGSRRGSI